MTTLYFSATSAKFSVLFGAARNDLFFASAASAVILDDVRREEEEEEAEDGEVGVPT